MFEQFKAMDLKDRFGKVTKMILANNGRTSVPHQVDYVKDRKVKLEPSEIGCYASHYGIFEQIVKEGWNNTLIMEDDCLFSNHFLPSLESLPEYDYLNFTHVTYGPAEHYHYEMVDKRLAKGYGFWFTNCYAITLETAQMFVERLQVQTDSIDCQIALLQKEINAFCFTPSIVTQNYKHQSTIIHTNNIRKNGDLRRPGSPVKG